MKKRKMKQHQKLKTKAWKNTEKIINELDETVFLSIKHLMRQRETSFDIF